MHYSAHFTLASENSNHKYYVEHNNANQKHRKEIKDKYTSIELALTEKHSETTAEREQHQRHLVLLHSALPPRIAYRVGGIETVNNEVADAVVIFSDNADFTANSTMLNANE
jgi:hypothetical protein